VQFIFQHFTLAEVLVKKPTADASDWRAKFFDHRKPLTTDDLVSLSYSFFMPQMDVILESAFKGVKAICPNSTHLLWFWSIKNAEIEGGRMWDEIEEGKDSYDRQDNYNVIGLAVYLFMQAKQAICTLTGTQTVLEKNAFANISKAMGPLASDFMLEVFAPLVNYCLRSKSTTVKALGIEAAGYLAIINQASMPIYASLGHLTKDETGVRLML
jgi:hypothetical protein